MFISLSTVKQTLYKCVCYYIAGRITLKVPVMTAADKILFSYFSKKVKLDISCNFVIHMNHMIHMKCQGLKTDYGVTIYFIKNLVFR